MRIYRERFLDVFRHIPLGMWMIAFATAVQFSPSILLRIKGGLTVCLVYFVGLFLCTSASRRKSALTQVMEAVHENRGMAFCLFVYYCFVVAAWFYAPFEIQYYEIQAIWKFHVLNILALVVGMYLSKNLRYLRFILLVGLPLLLYYVLIAQNLMVRMEVSARDADAGLGSTTLWESIAMYAVMLLGFVLKERNVFLKLSALAIMLYIDMAILKAGYATPFALLLGGMAVFAFCYMFYGKRDRLSKVKKFFIVGVFVVGVAAVVARMVSKYDEGKDVASVDVALRFSNLVKDPTGGGYDVEHSRLNSIDESWQGFKKAPFLGNGGAYPSNHYDYCGNHQALVDFLSLYGIFGALFFYVFLLTAVKNAIARYKMTKDWFDCASVAIAAMFVVGGIVNPCWQGLPMTAFFIFAMPFKNRELRWRYQAGFVRGRW